MISRFLALTILPSLLLGGCVASSSKTVSLEQGPPVETISTPYNDLLQCIASQSSMRGAWAVGQISDATGKMAVDSDGTGKFISQGAGDMMQTIMLTAGAEKLLNRRDPRPVVLEAKWGIRKLDQVATVDFYITGSINTLDFIPGASAEVSVMGVGPRYRQHRALVGLDLHITNAKTTEVIAAANISKQIFAEEAGFGIGRFFGTTFVDFDVSAGNREPLQLSLRSMLQFGLFELLKQNDPNMGPACQQFVDEVEGVSEMKKTESKADDNDNDSFHSEE
ncbi:MAG: CsgG/HfaB family protein [Sneathiella sp.]